VLVAVEQPRRDQQRRHRQAVLGDLVHPRERAEADVAHHHVERDESRYRAEEHRGCRGEALQHERVELHLLNSFLICGP
jgi:hypothetical protein